MTDASNESVVASVDTLVQDHRELFADLERGFASRRDLLIWMHKASARTLGELPDDWFGDLLTSRYRVSALLDVSERQRGRLLDHAPDDELAAFERDLLGDTVLLEACRAALQKRNEAANQYAELDGAQDGHEQTVDPSRQKYLGMLPSVDDLAGKQRSVLERAIGRGGHSPNGLQSRADVREWARDLQRVVTGADGGIAQKMMFSLWWRDLLTSDVESPTLHAQLGEHVLQRFNAAIRREAAAAREAPLEHRESHGALDTS